MGAGSLDTGVNDGVVWLDALSLGFWTSQARKCVVGFLFALGASYRILQSLAEGGVFSPSRKALLSSTLGE